MHALGSDGIGSKSWLHWGRNAVFAVLDQGLFAASGFITNILLARWLSAESFGAFALAYSVFLFLGTFYTQALPGPMLVFGAGRYAEGFRRYLAILLYGHIGITFSISAILLAFAAVELRFGSAYTVQALVALSVASPFILFLWLTRFAFYAKLQPQWAAAGSALYLAMVTIGIFALARAQALSTVSGLLLMGASSLIVGGLLTALLRPQWDGRLVLGRHRAEALSRLFRVTRAARPSGGLTAEPPACWGPSTVFSDHYQYAKWSSGASAASWFVSNLHYFVLSSTVGLGSVAAIRALDTALSPFLNVQTAMSRLLLTALGRRLRQPATDVWHFVIRMSAVWGSLAVMAYVLVRSFAPNILAVLYGSVYSQYGSVLGWYGLIIIATSIGEPILALLRAVVRNDLVFLYQVLFAVSLLVGYLFAVGHGLSGVVFVLILINFCILPVVFVSGRLVCFSGSRMAGEPSVSRVAE